MLILTTPMPHPLLLPLWSPHLEAEVHGGESQVISRGGVVIRQEVHVVGELEQSEVDESNQVRPNIYRLIGPNKRANTHKIHTHTWTCISRLLEFMCIWTFV